MGNSDLFAELIGTLLKLTPHVGANQLDCNAVVETWNNLVGLREYNSLSRN